MDDPSPQKPISATLVLLGCVSALAAHLATLYTSGFDPVTTPVAALSHSVDGNLHGLGLSLFAVGQIALAVLLDRPGAGWTTRVAQGLLVVDAALLVWLAWHFAGDGGVMPTGTGAGAPRPGDPLSLLASVTGLAMGFASPGLLRHHRRAGLWNLACFVVWLALVPLGLTVEASWIGAYERLVGAVFVAWAGGLAALVGIMVPRSTSDPEHGRGRSPSEPPGRARKDRRPDD